MKANPWISLVLAALVTGGWMISEKKSVSDLEEKISQVNARIELADSENHSEKSSEDTADGKNEKKIDRKSYSTKLAKMRASSRLDPRISLREDRALSEMSAGELCD